MKQSTLSFQPITADAAQQQRKSVAEQWVREHPDSGCDCGDAPPTQRGPGRPRIKRTLNLEQAAGEQPAAQKPRTGKYTNWFSSPYISDAVRATNYFVSRVAFRAPEQKQKCLRVPQTQRSLKFMTRMALCPGVGGKNRTRFSAVTGLPSY